MSLYVRVPHPRVKSRRKSAPALNFRPALAPRADSMSPSPMFVDNTRQHDKQRHFRSKQPQTNNVPVHESGSGVGPRKSVSSDEVFENFAEIFETLVVLLLCEGVPGGDEQGDGPIDDLEGDERCYGAIVGELLRRWEPNGADERKIEYKSLGCIESSRGSAFGRLSTSGRNGCQFAVC